MLAFPFLVTAAFTHTDSASHKAPSELPDGFFSVSRCGSWYTRKDLEGLPHSPPLAVALEPLDQLRH